MAIKTNKETEQKIIELYNQGLSMARVGAIYGVTAATVMRILNRNNIPKRTKGGIYKIPENVVIERYSSGESCQSIADDYKVSFHTISNILEKHNIKRNNRYKNIDFNIHYFKNIDSYDKAYFLGFLITDGSIGLKDNSIRLDLNNKDEDILQIFSQKTNNKNQLYKRKDKPETIFNVKCKQWKEDLSQYGVVPQKTATVYLPTLTKEMILT